MSKVALRITEAIQRRLPAPVQFVIAIALLSVSGFGPLDLELPISVSAVILLGGVGLLGTSMMPPVMSLFDASEWDELSGVGQLIVLSVVTVALFAFVFLSILI